jgi:hypothetical protein
MSTPFRAPARPIASYRAVPPRAGARSEEPGVASAFRMPAPSTAELKRPLAFPTQIGEPLWQERRRFPVAAAYGVPAAFLAVLAVSVRPPAAHAALAVAAVVTVALLLRARRRALIETYTVSERFIAIEQPGGGRVAIPTETLTTVTLAGDSVVLESSAGVLRLGFVARQHALVNALSHVAPDVPVERDVTAFCPTCTLRW